MKKIQRYLFVIIKCLWNRLSWGGLTNLNQKHNGLKLITRKWLKIQFWLTLKSSAGLRKSAQRRRSLKSPRAGDAGASVTDPDWYYVL